MRPYRISPHAALPPVTMGIVCVVKSTSTLFAHPSISAAVGVGCGNRCRQTMRRRGAPQYTPMITRRVFSDPRSRAPAYGRFRGDSPSRWPQSSRATIGSPRGVCRRLRDEPQIRICAKLRGMPVCLRSKSQGLGVSSSSPNFFRTRWLRYRRSEQTARS